MILPFILLNIFFLIIYLNAFEGEGNFKVVVIENELEKISLVVGCREHLEGIKIELV